MLSRGLKIIAHRGNIDGPDEKYENHPDQIAKAQKHGFDVEVDVWFENNKFYLGHDQPEYEIPSNFFENNKLWCHAKNIPALSELIRASVHCFWHQEDDVTLTSLGYLWTYPGKPLTKNSICVMPERLEHNNKLFISNGVAGICTDFPKRYLK